MIVMVDTYAIEQVSCGLQICCKSRVGFAHHREAPTEFIKGIEKIQEEKEKEIELKKKDAEDAINLARERKAKVCPFE